MVSVVTSIETGHEDMIHDGQLDFYGTQLATCSSDGIVKVFDVRDRRSRLIADLPGHTGPVWQVSWSHPTFGSLLASCGYDRRLVVWEPSSRSKLYEFLEHTSSVNTVAWAPSEYGNAQLAAGSSDGSISIHTFTGTVSAESAQVKRIQNAHPGGVNAISWAPAVLPLYAALFSASGERDSRGSQQMKRRLASGGCDNLVKIWLWQEETQGWALEAELRGHADWVRDVAWCPSVSGLPGRELIASAGQDCAVLIWVPTRRAPADAERERERAEWRVGWKLPRFPDVVWTVSWSVGGELLAVSCGDNQVSIWKQALAPADKPDAELAIGGDWVCVNDVLQSAAPHESPTAPPLSHQKHD